MEQLRNPNTGRLIKIGGPTHRYLMTQGILQHPIHLLGPLTKDSNNQSAVSNNQLTVSNNQLTVSNNSLKTRHRVKHTKTYFNEITNIITDILPHDITKMILSYTYPSGVKECGHSCDLTFITMCCLCVDKRTELYNIVYVDGIGDIKKLQPIAIHYCPTCKKEC